MTQVLNNQTLRLLTLENKNAHTYFFFFKSKPKLIPLKETTDLDCLKLLKSRGLKKNLIPVSVRRIGWGVNGGR